MDITQTCVCVCVTYSRLANLGAAAWSQGWGVPEFEELTRDTHSFKRRVGDLPVQKVSATGCKHMYKNKHTRARTPLYRHVSTNFTDASVLGCVSVYFGVCRHLCVCVYVCVCV